MNKNALNQVKTDVFPDFLGRNALVDSGESGIPEYSSFYDAGLPPKRAWGKPAKT